MDGKLLNYEDDGAMFTFVRERGVAAGVVVERRTSAHELGWLGFTVPAHTLD
jgi:hypothetical protein